MIPITWEDAKTVEMLRRTAEATDQRLRVSTLMLRTYEEARAAIGHLRRREEDAESIAPTLYPRKGRRRAPETAPAVPPAPQPPTSNAPVSADITQPIPVVTPAQIAPQTPRRLRRGRPRARIQQGSISDLKSVREAK